MGLQTFPGVYTQIVDDSFFTPSSSRFRGGYVGVAQKGPVNVPTPVSSLADFNRQFGNSLPGQYLSAAAQLTTDISDGVTIVRIASQYQTVAGSGSNRATGTSGGTVIATANAPFFNLGQYVRVTQDGLETTVNGRVQSKTVNSLTLTSDVTLAATYTAADVEYSDVINAANLAEAFLEAPLWQTTPVGGDSTPVLVTGDKSTFQFTVTDNPTDAIADIPVGAILLISQGDGFVDTAEVMVASIIPAAAGAQAIFNLQPTDRTDIGYQSTSLQDSYSAAKLYLLNVSTPYVRVAHLTAANPGTWANSDGETTGLIVRVAPGSAPNSKKLRIYEDSALAEEIDNLVADPTDPNFYETIINGNDSFITITMLEDLQLANTADGWSPTATKLNVAAFVGGFDGENVSDTDYIGTIDPITELGTGLKIFEDPDANLNLSVMACPGVTDLSVAQEMGRICRLINAIFVFDIPQGLNLRQATDWHNGLGPYRAQGKLDMYSGAFFWNWITITDAFTGLNTVVPASCGALRCLAYTFDAAKPWIAAAGEKNGLIPEALAVQYPRVSSDAKQASYRNGNCINPILINQGRIMLFGDVTMQRADSKLSDIHSVIMVNYAVNGMAIRGRRFLFDPIDEILLDQISAEFTAFLETIKTERGIEDYGLIVDKTNNSADDRNQRQVNVNFYVIPLGALEKLNIFATVRASGASVTAVQ